MPPINAKGARHDVLFNVLTNAGAPIQNARIYLNDVFGGFTDANGQATINIKEGVYTVKVDLGSEYMILEDFSLVVNEYTQPQFLYVSKHVNYAAWLPNSKLILDYNYVNYNASGVYTSFEDQSLLQNNNFSLYNMGSVIRGSDGSMNWQSVSDSHRYIMINGLNTNNHFPNGMTIISLFKVKNGSDSPMKIGTAGHNNDNTFHGWSGNAVAGGWTIG